MQNIKSTIGRLEGLGEQFQGRIDETAAIFGELASALEKLPKIGRIGTSKQANVCRKLARNLRVSDAGRTEIYREILEEAQAMSPLSTENQAVIDNVTEHELAMKQTVKDQLDLFKAVSKYK